MLCIISCKSLRLGDLGKLRKEFSLNTEAFRTSFNVIELWEATTRACAESGLIRWGSEKGTWLNSKTSNGLFDLVSMSL